MWPCKMHMSNGDQLPSNLDTNVGNLLCTPHTCFLPYVQIASIRPSQLNNLIIIPARAKFQGRVANFFERMRRACPRLPVSSLESISKCAVDSVRVAGLDNECASAQRAKNVAVLTCAKENCNRSCLCADSAWLSSPEAMVWMCPCRGGLCFRCL